MRWLHHGIGRRESDFGTRRTGGLRVHRYRGPRHQRPSRNQAFLFCFVLPTGGTSFVEFRSEQVRLTAEWMAPQRAYIGTVMVDRP